MKILLDMQGAQCQSRYRGIGRYSLELAKAFAAHAAERHDLRFAFNAAFGEATDAAISALFPHANRHHRTIFHSLHDVAAQRAYSDKRRVAAEQLVRHVLSQASADVLWYSSVAEGYVDDAVIPAPPVSKSLSVATLYDLIPLHDPQAYLDHPRVRAWYDARCKILARCDLLLAISDWVREDAMARLNLSAERVITIGAGVDARFIRAASHVSMTEQQRRQLGVQRPYVLYNGGFDPRKNVGNLVGAYADLPVDIRDRYQFVIVGRTTAEQLAQLKTAMYKTGLTDSDVVFTGFVDDDVLVKLYSGCNLFVFPSVMEGFGLPPLEAMACGAPVIASNTSSLSEILGNPDATFNPQRREAITRRMLEVLERPELADALRLKGQQQARKHSWDAVAQRALDAIERLHCRNRGTNRPRHKPRLCCIHACPPPAWVSRLETYYTVESLELAVGTGHDAPVPNDSLGKADRILYVCEQRQLETLSTWMQQWPGALLALGPWEMSHRETRTPAHAAAAYRSLGYAGLLGDTPLLFADATAGGACIGLLFQAHETSGVTPFEAPCETAILPSSFEPSACAHHLETWYAASPLPAETKTLDALARTVAGSLSDNDLALVCDSIVAARPVGKTRQWLVDVTQIARNDIGTGIQRVVRSILAQWLRHPPEHVRIEPIALVQGTYRYARRYALDLLELPPNLLADDFVAVGAGDTYVALDWGAEALAASEPLLRDWHRLGVDMHFVVHDLLPVSLPDAFHPFARKLFIEWLHRACSLADQVHCVSRTTAATLNGWLARTALVYQFGRPPRVDSFTLGTEPAFTRRIRTELPTALAGAVEQRPTLLMVGTLEPRKGHAFALDAVEQLWALGHDINFVMVGRHGWMLESLIKRLEVHAERDRRLFWLDGADDGMLDAVYGSATVLLAPSLGEGFGLPLVEAARRGLPIIARSLPVFHEVMGDYPSYFESTDPQELAQAIAAWLACRPLPGIHPNWPSWAECATTLGQAIRSDANDAKAQTTG